MLYYVRVRGVWDGSPAIYFGPFGERESALEAIHGSGAALGAAALDPKHDVEITILTDEESRLVGRKERHTLLFVQHDGRGEGFKIPVNWAEFSKLFYRRFGYH